MQNAWTRNGDTSLIEYVSLLRITPIKLFQNKKNIYKILYESHFCANFLRTLLKTRSFWTNILLTIRLFIADITWHRSSPYFLCLDLNSLSSTLMSLTYSVYRNKGQWMSNLTSQFVYLAIFSTNSTMLLSLIPSLTRTVPPQQQSPGSTQ